MAGSIITFFTKVQGDIMTSNLGTSKKLVKMYKEKRVKVQRGVDKFIIVMIKSPKIYL